MTTYLHLWALAATVPAFRRLALPCLFHLVVVKLATRPAQFMSVLISIANPCNKLVMC